MRRTFVTLAVVLTIGCNSAAGNAPGNSTTVELSWTSPTTNRDSSELTELAGYHLYWSTTSGAETAANMRDLGILGCQATGLNGGGKPCALSYSYTPTSAGTWYFVVTAYDSNGYESVFSNEVSATVP